MEPVASIEVRMDRGRKKAQQSHRDDARSVHEVEINIKLGGKGPSESYTPNHLLHRRQLYPSSSSSFHSLLRT